MSTRTKNVDRYIKSLLPDDLIDAFAYTLFRLTDEQIYTALQLLPAEQLARLKAWTDEEVEYQRLEADITSGIRALREQRRQKVQ